MFNGDLKMENRGKKGVEIEAKIEAKKGRTFLHV